MKCNRASFESDRPQIKVLSREKSEKIHEASLEILQDTGVSVRLPEAVELLATAGCEVKGDLVKIPRRIVEACLDMAPDRIDVYDRLENPPARAIKRICQSPGGFNPGECEGTIPG